MKERFYEEMLASIYLDYASMCGVQPDHRDLKVLSRRCRQEGYRFLSIALPKLRDSLFTSLERGKIDSTDFSYFKKTSAKYPRLFGVFFSRIFDDRGRLLPDACVYSIQAIRQLTSTFYKVKEICSDDKVVETYHQYIRVEQEIDGSRVPAEWDEHFDSVNNILWSSLRTFNSFDTRPQHGPGAVAEGVKHLAKYDQLFNWPLRLENYFPSDLMMLVNHNFTHLLERINYVHEEEETPVWVIAVPKTASKPRIIAEEPTPMQFCQQGVRRWIYDHLERVNVFTKGHVNFTDQSINQSLALDSSLTRQYSTIDMSDASDRITVRHIESMLKKYPDYLGAIMACRSTRAQVNGKIIPLSKFASMGSALCFPTMAMFFFAVCVSALTKHVQRPSFLDVYKASRKIFIYGDDIIVPTESTPDVIAALTAFGGKVSTAKSFWKGYFRESCGVDAYKGIDITPVYLRRHIPKSHRSPDWESIVEFTNGLYIRGLWRTARLVQDATASVIGAIPVMDPDSVGVHYFSMMGIPDDLGLPRKYRKYNPELQTDMFYIPVVKLRSEKRRLKWKDRHHFIMDWHIKNFTKTEEINVSQSVLRANRDVRGTLKRRWHVVR